MILARLFLSLLIAGLAFSQTAPDNEKIWQDFVGWVKVQREIADVGSDKYYSSLIQGGLTPAQASECMAIVGKLYPERRKELSGVYMNKLYTSPMGARARHPCRLSCRSRQGVSPLADADRRPTV